LSASEAPPRPGLTPALRQYLETKEAWPGSFLFFQIGDFFELFFEDAEAVAPLLDLSLTSRQKIDGVPVPMCGVPLAAGESYVNRLAAMGHRVVVFEQEAAAGGEKIVRRRLARVVTPGTIVSDDGPAGSLYMAVVLHESQLPLGGRPPSGLAWHEEEDTGTSGSSGASGASGVSAPGSPRPALRQRTSPPSLPRQAGASPAPVAAPEAGWWFMAAADLSTGDFQLARAADFEGLVPEITAFGPSEILYPSPCPPELKAFLERSGIYSAGLGPEAFEGAEDSLSEVFGSQFRSNLPELWERPGAPLACGAAVKRFLGLAPGSNLSHLAPPRLLWSSPSLSLDEAALRNLELVRSLRDGGTRGTLFELLDLSSTPMGSRTLQEWLVRPSGDRATVESRHAAVEELLGDSAAREKLRAGLKSLRDLEKAVSRITLGRGAVRDLYQLKAALDLAPTMRELLDSMSADGLLRRIADGIAEVLGDAPAGSRSPAPAGFDAAAPVVSLAAAQDGSRSGPEPFVQPAAPTGDPIDVLAPGLTDRAENVANVSGGALPSLFDPGSPSPAPAPTPAPPLSGAAPHPLPPSGPAPHPLPPSGAPCPARPACVPAGTLRSLKRALDICLAPRLEPGSPEGAAVRDGCSPVLDTFRSLERDRMKAIAALEGRERARTGLSHLKVGYTRVFGYFIEIQRRFAEKAPPEWTRRQTLAGAERFTSPELMELEGKLLTAGERRDELERRILSALRGRAAAASSGAKRLSGLMAGADALLSLAEAARRHGWVRPRITADDVIDITAGRHPVVEASLPRGEAFVANDVLLSPRERVLVVTGPNMAGKSTILRQTALIVIMCQMGSFVPAEKARLSIRDAVFTRVGAADDLARGRSTFMVEMSETARILARATPRSLVVLDEVGRGTSTMDGLAIAWAVAEYLHDRAGRGVPTLFATHYHELVDLARSKPMAVNYNVAVRKWQGKVVFLRKLMPGGTSRSYGLAVAALAGLPKAVTDRASEVLRDLLEGARRTIRPEIRPRGLFGVPSDPEDGPEPMGLWAPDGLADDSGAPGTDARGAEPTGTGPSETDRPGAGSGRAASPGGLARAPLIAGADAPDDGRDRLIADIGAIDTEALTPLEALNLVHALKIRAGGLL
jgi:DNA mismatch repair protein MutS